MKRRDEKPKNTAQFHPNLQKEIALCLVEAVLSEWCPQPCAQSFCMPEMSKTVNVAGVQPGNGGFGCVRERQFHSKWLMNVCVCWHISLWILIFHFFERCLNSGAPKINTSFRNKKNQRITDCDQKRKSSWWTESEKCTNDNWTATWICLSRHALELFAPVEQTVASWGCPKREVCKKFFLCVYELLCVMKVGTRRGSFPGCRSVVFQHKLFIHRCFAPIMLWLGTTYHKTPSNTLLHMRFAGESLWQTQGNMADVMAWSQRISDFFCFERQCFQHQRGRQHKVRFTIRSEVFLEKEKETLDGPHSNLSWLKQTFFGWDHFEKEKDCSTI